MPKNLHQFINLQKGIVHVSPQTTVADAVRTMAENNVGAVVILESKRLAGIFTERDLLRRVVAQGRDPGATPISEVMTANVIVAKSDDSYEEVLQIMNTTKCRHIPIVEGESLKGIVSMRDLLRYDNEEKAFEVDQLKSYFFHG